jgi:carboxyl-terminal processing protease
MFAFIFKKKKVLISVFLAGFVFIIIGASNSDTYRSIARSQRIINEVYKHLIVNYVDELDTDEFTKTSINNMLSDLDPYTVYLESEDRDNLDMLTHGKYGGVGIQLGKRDDHLTVISPMEDSPAMRAGILSGDIISKIDEEEVKDISLDDAAKLIRGKKGTTVVLTIIRIEKEEPIEFYLTRTDIMVQDVPYAEMINDDIGYIVLTRFSKNAPMEMKNALRSLIDQGMNNLILDLRNNPGGLLSAAIEILELIFPKGEKLLWTKGRTKESNREFISRKNPLLDSKIKIAVLINEGSASASEIVSGVIQDLDRGIVIGNKSFGKGLVQSVYGIDQKRSLKVTTAKYYIPSGRLIQKPDYLNKKVIKSVAMKDSVFTTKGGRNVEGGGGITPDYIVEDVQVGPLTRECWRKSYFFSFARENKNIFQSFEDVLNNEKLMDTFSDYLANHELEIKIDGQSQFEQSKEKLKKYDDKNAKLNYAFKMIDEFIVKTEKSLFENEYSDLEKGVFTNFAQIFDGNKGRIRFNVGQDEVINKARQLLQDKMAYLETFHAVSNN